MIYTQEQLNGMSERVKLFIATVKLCAIKGNGIKYDNTGLTVGLIPGEDNTQDIEVLKLEPNDIMPIAFEHGISVISKATVDGKYRASTGSIISPSVMTRNTNPLIAIVDVFLMMEV